MATLWPVILSTHLKIAAEEHFTGIDQAIIRDGMDRTSMAEILTTTAETNLKITEEGLKTTVEGQMTTVEGQKTTVADQRTIEGHLTTAVLSQELEIAAQTEEWGTLDMETQGEILEAIPD